MSQIIQDVAVVLPKWMLMISMKDLSNFIREFENLPHEIYERRSTKHETNYSYFYLARNLAECMMRADALKSHV